MLQLMKRWRNVRFDSRKTRRSALGGEKETDRRRGE